MPDLRIPSRPADEYVEVPGVGLVRNDDLEAANPYQPVENVLPQGGDGASRELEDLTWEELRALPVYNQIEGRSGMSKEELIEAIRNFEPIDPTDQEDEE